MPDHVQSPTHADAPADAGPLDEVLRSLVKQRFEALMERFPVFATYVGLHQHDHRLSDASREAVEGDIADAYDYLSRVEAIDPAGLSADGVVERDLAIHATRRHLFDDEVHRLWERRVSATDELGDGIFLLFARQTRPLSERLTAIRSRLEAGPRLIEQHRRRLGDRPVRLWNELELQAAGSLPVLFDEVLATARRELGEDHSETAALAKASDAAKAALEDYVGWIRRQFDGAGDDYALGGEIYDWLIGLREFDGLTTDDILEIGYEQLSENRAARKRIAAEIDPDSTEQEVLERIKTDHPPDFAGALASYRRAMDEARQYVIDHDIATVPPYESLSVVETPDYLRTSLPFAAYFSPPKFEQEQQGIYVVTPSVDGDPRAMREHNYASIYNTSIHEAYPGHHQQLTAANAHPSLARPLVDAPEFVEGWAMYSEQMMREQGFDDSPEHRLMMHTDAIWRACRIILDIRLHRRDVGVAEAIDFLVDQTGFERPNATAEVQRYTYTPTYQLSYLLGKVLLLRLRAEEQARMGSDFSLRAFHDALLNAGSIPISYHRRLLGANATGQAAGRTQAAAGGQATA